MNPFATIRQWARQRNQNRVLRSLGYMGSGGYVPAAPVLSGTFVTAETALGLAAVYSAINVIARDIAVLPRTVYRQLGNGGREPETKGELGELNDIISAQPSEDYTGFRWMQDSMGHVLARGNSFSEIVRKRGYVQSLELLHPHKTVVKRTERAGGAVGRLYYELENKRELWPDNVLHLSGFGFNGIVGYAPTTLMRQTLGITMAAEQFAASFYGNGAFTSGWLKTAAKLGEAAVNTLRKTYNQIHQGSQSAHQIGILDQGMDFQPNQISPEDAQMILSREFQVKDIARIFSIPPHKIGDYSESHLANVEEANLDYVSMTLLGWICMIEAEMNSKLLTREQRQTHTIGIDMSMYLRGNIQAQMLRVQTLRNTGAWSANDIRVNQGMNPIPDGDGYFVQAQYIPLDQVGKQPAAAPKPGAPEQKQSLLSLEQRIIDHAYQNGAAA